jgi:diguanylate cyclase (GGDEF)-like protein
MRSIVPTSDRLALLSRFRKSYQKLPVRYQLMIGMVLPLLLAGAISVTVFQVARMTQVTDAQASQTAEILLLSQQLMVSILNAQTGTRGFVISGDEQFLRPYAVALEEFADASRQLRQRWAEQPQRLALLNELVVLFERYQREITEVAIASRRSVGQVDGSHPIESDLMEAPRRLFVEGNDKQLVDDMKRMIEQLILEERRALNEQLGRNLDQGGVVILIGTAGPLLAVFLVLLVGGRHTARITRNLDSLASAAGRIETGDLEGRVELLGSRETAALAARFNRMAERLEQRARNAVLLDRLGKKLQSCKNMDEAFAVASAYLPRILRDTSGAICLYRASRDQVETHTAWGGMGEAGSKSGVFEPDHCWALRTGYTYHYDPDGEDMPCRHLGHPVAGETLCVPMISDEDVLGILVAQSVDSGGLNSEQKALAGHLAETLAICVTNLRLRESLRNQSVRDPLTDLYNRRYLNEALKREFARVERTGSPVSIIVFDVDHFKRFNDSWGHDAGDAVLVRLARMLREIGRDSDLACRLGGEEFALVLPDCSLDQAMEVAEKIRISAQELKIHLHGKLLEPVTVSLGVASCPEQSCETAALIKAADMALYRAKAQGRDRVERAS